MAWLKTKKNSRRWAAVLFLAGIGFFALLFDTNTHNYNMTCVQMNFMLGMRQMSLVDWQCKLNESRSRSKFEFDIPRVHVHVISLARSFERRRECVEALQIQNISSSMQDKIFLTFKSFCYVGLIWILFCPSIDQFYCDHQESVPFAFQSIHESGRHKQCHGYNPSDSGWAETEK